MVRAPILHDLCDEFRAVVDAQPLGLAPPFDKPVQFPDDALTVYAPVDGDVQGLAFEIVDHVEGPEGKAPVQGVLHEVHAPGQVRI